MSDIHISPAVLEAGARAAYEERCRRISQSFPPWEQLAKTWKDDHRAEARATFVAMVRAWDGMWPDRFDGVDTICLPLTEKQDDKA